MADVFVYTGNGGEIVPPDVRRVLVDPSVTSIPAEAFQRCKKLAEVELCEGLVEIGEYSFRWCEHSIIKINIPNSLRRIRDNAFARALQTPVHLHDDVENIGFGAFAECIFTNFRVPPLITVIARAMLSNCKAMFSAELPESVIEIGGSALFMCPCLRNVAFPPHVRMDAAFGDRASGNYWDLLQSTAVQNDLYQLFGSIPRMIQELKHRFDGLPIHRIIYYQSYNQGVLQNISAATSNLEPTGNQQDCLGMTPLHILACSSVHDFEVYRVIVEKYPGNLITEDAWGALPLLYAFWGAAPAEIIQFLLDSYQSLYPGHAFNWTMMVKTMGRTDTPKERIEYLLCVHQTYFPEQSINWDFLLNEFSRQPEIENFALPFTHQSRMSFLVMCGLSTRVEALPKVWRDEITISIEFKEFDYFGDDEQSIIREIYADLENHEGELSKITDATSTLELALWKMNMDLTSHRETVNVDDPSVRRLCRVTCGADIIIRNVLPYLIGEPYSDSDDEDYFVYAISNLVKTDPESNAASDNDESSDLEHAASDNDESSDED